MVAAAGPLYHHTFDIKLFQHTIIHCAVSLVKYLLNSVYDSSDQVLTKA